MRTLTACDTRGAKAGYRRLTSYEEGEDYAEAAKWYRRAAEQGDVDAQARLEEMYEEGLVVRKE